MQLVPGEAPRKEVVRADQGAQSRIPQDIGRLLRQVKAGSRTAQPLLRPAYSSLRLKQQVLRFGNGTSLW